MNIDVKHLRDFLIEARSQTYAANKGKTKPLIPGTTQLEYKKGKWLYRDIYDGEIRFQGREVVYHWQKPIWGMVYEGGIENLSKKIHQKDVYLLLQRVLLKYIDKVRISGEVDYQEDELHYQGKTTNQTNEIGKFWGEENITYKGKIIYQLAYGGGWIKGVL